MIVFYDITVREVCGPREVSFIDIREKERLDVDLVIIVGVFRFVCYFLFFFPENFTLKVMASFYKFDI